MDGQHAEAAISGKEAYFFRPDFISVVPRLLCGPTVNRRGQMRSKPLQKQLA